ncbi:acyl-CoA N-acyltransferase [Protomyces lactucae-debilis]|uniref:Glycylpeptide N-tetradecanoyltransferase n=1 Tax=Protomyces lactucae-debilis TaxID=2754530 RepID=A0A1Y2FH68_PROLT|nr:acyl-CoA N-acyltransferase [Protomyces lactucae-debilis]ORY83298.1 acyl-CoA N-acyltransferase [Protomyces lactucae-debilis]
MSDQPPQKKGPLEKVKDKLSKGKSNGDDNGDSSAAPLVQNNLSLDQSLGQKSLEQLMKQLTTGDLLTGMAPGGKNKKDMASYKFWSTQPVAKFEEVIDEEGAIEAPSDVPDEPTPLLKDFEWVTMDLDDPAELKEVYELLTQNYVEDDDASFRFDYSASFLQWALQAPGFHKSLHVGVRVRASKRLVGFISGIPITLRARNHDLKSSEINFLCVHKKLRSKRLAPTLIKEVTRRCHQLGIWQAVYTAGVVLPKPFSSCRYYHRSLDWVKLHDIGFSHLPARSTKARQITKYKLPINTSIAGLRLVTKADVPAVGNLLRQTLARYDVSQVFSDEEVEHWFVGDPNLGQQDKVVWTYVVEQGGKITEFVSFYSLPSSVIGNAKHKKVNAAYLFYYGSESYYSDRSNYETRLKKLINDALILANNIGFDVFNALTLLDNPMFLDELKFGPGDGFLNYYLYNWRMKPVEGGLKTDGRLEVGGSQVGLVML